MVNPVLKKVNMPTGEMGDFEKKHVPVIDAPDSVKADEVFEVKLTVGELVKHPNEIGHHIEWIELYWNDVLMARAELEAELTDPKVTFRVRVDESGVLKAVEKCNLHGIWAATKSIKVE
ncbi:MAG: class II SORL domain-containing protein [Methermicoccaceae archaeon]